MSEEQKQDAEPEAGAKAVEFVERVGFVDRIYRSLNFSVFGISLLAVPVGIIAAYGAWGFREAFGLLGRWFRGEAWQDNGLVHLAELGLGGLLFGLVLQWLKWQRFRTPAHVIVAVSENEGRLQAKDGLVTSIADALALALAAPVGRYGPAVHLGATLGSMGAQLLKLGATSVRILLGCGVAAAISASFNAPIAGVIFAHEVVIGHFRLRAFAPITLASVAAVGVTRYHEVQYVALKLLDAPPQIALEEYPLYLLLGLAASLVAMVYMVGIMQATRSAERLRLPRWTQPAIGGVLAGLVALWIPQVLGLGDELLQAVVAQNLEAPSFGPRLLLMLGVAKLVASVCCLGLRYPGGAFTPAMFIGAMWGGFCGMVLPAVDYQISVLAGMGAVVGSVVGAPLSVILIVFELTENYEAATAVMVAVVSSNAVVTRFFARSLFHRQIRFWGIEINRPEEQRILAKRSVNEVARKKPVTVRADDAVGNVRGILDRYYHGTVYVVDAVEGLVGALPGGDWDEVPDDRPVSEFVRKPGLILTSEESVWNAFEKMEQSSDRVAPVVDTDENRKLVGVVTMGDFLGAYRRAVRQSRQDR